MIKSCSVLSLRVSAKVGNSRFRPVRPIRKRRSFAVHAHRIAVLPGDGIGPEITNVALKLLKIAADQTGEDFIFEEAPFGGAAIDVTGEAYPESTRTLCKNSDAVLLAAIGGDKWDHLPAKDRPERGLLELRASLGTFANLRPALVFDQLAAASSLKESVVNGVDLMIVRELNGGIYYGQPRGIKEDSNGQKIGFNTMSYTESEIERIAHVGFELAMKRSGRLCSVEKSNVLEVSQLWKEVVTRVSHQYPDVQLEHMYVDNACMQLISQPNYFDTILTGNIFGDILSDGAAALTGSLGLLPSASISSSGPGIFEPVHGSAPTIAGLDVANPIAMVFSASMMCKYGLELPQISSMLDSAVFRVLEKGFRTKDIFSEGKEEVSCSQMGNKLIEEMEVLMKT